MELSDFLPRFNPHPRIEAVPPDPVHLPGDLCLVVEDLLLNPQALVELSGQWREHFQAPAGSAYPGLEQWMPPAVTGLLDDWCAVFYDGGLFHCSDNGPAGALPDDPRTGRLAPNGFINCTRSAR